MPIGFLRQFSWLKASPLFRARLLQGLRIAVSLTVLGLILRMIPMETALSTLRGADPGLAVLALLSILASLWFSSWRWKLLMQLPEVPVARLFGWNLVGAAAGFILPSSASGDLVKAIFFGKESGAMGRAVASTVLGRYFGLVVMVILTTLGFLLWDGIHAAVSRRDVLLLGGASLASVLALLALGRYLRKRQASEDAPPGRSAWSQRLARSLVYVASVTSQPSLFLSSLALSLVMQFLVIIGSWLLLRSVGSDVPLSVAVSLVPLVQLGTLLPVSLGGVGVREGLTLALFHYLAGVPKELCLASNLLGYLVNASLALLGALWWLAFARRRQGAPRSAP